MADSPAEYTAMGTPSGNFTCVPSPNAPRPGDPVTQAISDMLARISRNYDLEGSGPGTRFEGRLLEDVQAEAVIRRYGETLAAGLLPPSHLALADAMAQSLGVTRTVIFRAAVASYVAAPALPLDVGDVKTCDCGILIFFAMTGNGKPMPVVHDSAGDPAGTLAVWREGARLRCQVLNKTEREQEAAVLDRLLTGLGRVRYRSHFADCPNAGHHRRAR
jgi:hypothetical protein